MIKRITVGSIVAVIFVVWSQSAFSAMSNEQLLQRLNDLSTIIQKQQQEIERLRQELQNQQKSINQVQETQQHEIRKAVKSEVQEQEKGLKKWVPEWVKNTKLSGDLRLRYEGIYDRDRQLPDGSWEDIQNRERYRLRARLFVDSLITDEISTHLMVSTNDDINQNPTVSNQTLNNDFNDKGIYLARAYVTYLPLWLPGLEITAGKFKNTFLHTDIMWDPDVNPEGAYERYMYLGWEKVHPFVQLGQMSVNESDLRSNDASLFIYQGGFDWKIGPVKWTLAGSYYNWRNLENTRYLHLATYKGGGGNTYVAREGGLLEYKYDYDLLEAISFVDFNLGPLPTRLIFDYIVNTDDEVPSDQDSAYSLGFQVGKEKKKGDWSFWYKYARIEKDAVIGSLNDGDFYGSNREGHKLQLRYMFFDRVQIRTSFFYTDPIIDWNPDSPTYLLDQFRGHEDRLQVDLLFFF